MALHTILLDPHAVSIQLFPKQTQYHAQPDDITAQIPDLNWNISIL